MVFNFFRLAGGASELPSSCSSSSLSASSSSLSSHSSSFSSLSSSLSSLLSWADARLLGVLCEFAVVFTISTGRGGTAEVAETCWLASLAGSAIFGFACSFVSLRAVSANFLGFVLYRLRRHGDWHCQSRPASCRRQRTDHWPS